MTLVIGLTGGIGSGKTTVAHLFATNGVPIIDSDLIAREVTEPGSSALNNIVKQFGAHVLNADGTLNRQQLRYIIFKDPAQRLWLEQLLHPIIIERCLERIKRVSAPYCIVVIPLLLETGPYPFIDRILIIDTTENLQLSRVTNRDDASTEQIQAIISTQINREERLKRADDIITNNSDLANLVNQVAELHKIYLSISKK